MADDELLPSQVRAKVLEDHRVLRDMMTRLRAAASALRDGPEAAGEFQEACLTLLEKLRAHLALEDEILLPTLRTIDAWGPERAKRLEKEHASQRQVIDLTERQLCATDERPTAEIIGRMEQFVDRLEKDMLLEEKTSLDEELLREFPIRTDFGGA